MSILIHYSIVNTFTNWFGQIRPRDRDMVFDQSFDSLVYCVGGRSWSTCAGAEKGYDMVGLLKVSGGSM